MPAMLFDTKFVTATTEHEINLYDVYAYQFDFAYAFSDRAPSINDQISFLTPTDFYYYVVSYDTTVFKDITINEEGKMIYKLLKDGDESTYMNIVFVKKR
jgi:hypothetical protein